MGRAKGLSDEEKGKILALKFDVQLRGMCQGPGIV